MTTDTHSTFDANDMMRLVGYDMSRAAANKVYEQAGVGPEDIEVVELHDCFAQNELITYEALGLCPEGGAEAFIDAGDNTYGGKVVTNPSGGLLSKGHPLGATGLAQCYELTRQLRGTAEATQVDGVAARPAAQPRPRRRLRRHAVREGVSGCGARRRALQKRRPPHRCGGPSLGRKRPRRAYAANLPHRNNIILRCSKCKRLEVCPPKFLRRGTSRSIAAVDASPTAGFRLVDVPKIRRSTTAALSERGNSVADERTGWRPAGSRVTIPAPTRLVVRDRRIGRGI